RSTRRTYPRESLHAGRLGTQDFDELLLDMHVHDVPHASVHDEGLSSRERSAIGADEARIVMPVIGDFRLHFSVTLLKPQQIGPHESNTSASSTSVLPRSVMRTYVR